jgi:hypothetical protein
MCHQLPYLEYPPESFSYTVLSVILVTTIVIGKPEGKRPLGSPRRRWVDNIKMDLREIEWGGMDWIYLAQDRD